MRIYMVSDTVKKGGGGKKASTAAKRRRKQSKPKPQDDYLSPDWDPF
jgi:hypothetical protein